MIDTVKLTISLAPHEIQKLRRVLDEWPPLRKSATVKQVSQLTGFVYAYFPCNQAGKVLFFVRRLLMAACIPCSGAEERSHEVFFSEHLHNSARVVCLGPESHGDPEFRDGCIGRVRCQRRLIVRTNI